MSISIDEWGYIQTMEYYSAINRNEALMHVAMWSISKGEVHLGYY